MSSEISGTTLIRSAHPGTAIYARGEFDENMIKETMFLIREEPRVVSKLGENPVVIARTGLLEEQGVALVVVILRIVGEYYETWWNYHQTGDGAKYFQDMATQPRIPILFFSPDLARKLAISNSLAPFFVTASKRIADLPAWTMPQFDAARERIYARYSTVTKLWNALDRV